MQFFTDTKSLLSLLVPQVSHCQLFHLAAVAKFLWSLQIIPLAKCDLNLNPRILQQHLSSFSGLLIRYCSLYGEITRDFLCQARIKFQRQELCVLWFSNSVTISTSVQGAKMSGSCLWWRSELQVETHRLEGEFNLTRRRNKSPSLFNWKLQQTNRR
jgi:hypothetical protein